MEFIAIPVLLSETGLNKVLMNTVQKEPIK
ncbi:MAG: hypothetical protein K0S32_2694 [Bacteroidetes bacterium]|jgi:hypothetical protein|nr:hypothetical protein [Bacteroidota bacterium]